MRWRNIKKNDGCKKVIWENVLLLYAQLRIMKKRICMRKEHCHYVKVSEFICENRAGDQRTG